jgi:hypothetical protein
MKKNTAWIFLGMMVTAGCAATTSLATRHNTADTIAATAQMKENIIPAGLFNVTTWERIQALSAPIDLYIEGDGLAWLNKYTASLNPTPPDPIALRLAAADAAENVVYMARVCQYSSWNHQGSCPDVYWTTGLAAPEALASYGQALDDIKSRYHATGFNLIGYSGGAAIAVLLAAARDDVISIRTVAGNTDYDAFTTLHGLSPMKDSLRPAAAATKIAHIPQRHFVGGRDTVVPSAIFDSWKKDSAGSPCVKMTLLPSATHEKGWVETWPALLAVPLSCEMRS